MTAPIDIPDSTSVARQGVWKRLALGAGVAGAVALPLALSAITGHALTATRLMGADTLWTFAFVRDILSGGGHLADWNLAQHADFFPDKIVAVVAYLVSERPETWLFAFETLNLALYFGIAWFCFRLLAVAAQARSPGALALWAAVFVTVLPAFLRSWGVFATYFQYAGGPAQHFGAYFGALLAAFLAIDSIVRPRARGCGRRLSTACLLILLCGVSDKLSIALAIPGLTVAAAYAAATQPQFRGRAVLSCVSMCIAAALAYIGGDWLWRGIVEVSPATPHFGVVRIEQQIRYLLLSLLMPAPSSESLSATGVILPPQHHWTGLADLARRLDPLQTTLTALALLFVSSLATTYCARVLAALRGQNRAADAGGAAVFIVYLVASAVLLPTALMAGGVLYSQGVELYVFPAAYCIIWALAAQLCSRLAPALTRRQLASATIVTGLLLSTMPVDRSQPPFAPAVEPPLARCLETFGKTRDLGLGLGAHWDTYPIEFATGGRVVVRAITGDAKISHWVDSYAWYAPRDDGRQYTFVVLGEEVEGAALSRAVGPPTERLDCASLGPGFSTRIVFVYDQAGAARLTARIADQFVRSAYR